MKPNCWDCKYFERLKMSAYCHGGKRITKLRQKDWYSGSVKFCTYFEPKAEERNTNYIDQAETLDREELIHCKDCIHYYGEPGNPNIICFQMHDNDFCSYGERI